MSKQSEADRSPVAADVEARLSGDGVAHSGFDLFLRLLLASTDMESLSSLDAGALAREASAAFASLASRRRGQPRIATRPSHVIASGTVLEIVNDDMPFLLDSVLAEMQARGHRVALVLHPLYKVDREPDGQLVGVTGPADDAWGDGRQESYIAVHLARTPSAQGLARTEAPGDGALSDPRQAELVAAVSAILGEVRHAVTDWKPMLLRLSRAIEELAGAPAQVPAPVLDERLAFLAWLAEGNFTFLGTRDYRLDGPAATGTLVTSDDAGLGLLRDPGVHVLRRDTELVAMTPEVREFFFAPDPLIIAKANVVTRVHRRVHMDYIGIKRYGSDGQVVGELRLVGLFTSTAYTQSPRRIPVLRRKVAEMLERLALPPQSHAGKALVNVLETFPRDELFQIGIDDLQRWVTGILDLELRPRPRVFMRKDRFDRFVSVLVFAPRDRFSTSVRERIGERLAETFGGYIAAFYPFFNESPLVRVHYIVARRTGALPDAAVADVEAAIAAISRTWTDDLHAAIEGSGPGAGQTLAAYGDAFPAGYADVCSPGRAIADIAGMQRLGPDRPLAVDIYRETDALPRQIRAAIYCLDGPIPLSERVPVLENMGFAVIDERTFELSPRLDGRKRSVVLHDMLLEAPESYDIGSGAALDAAIEETFVAVLRRAAENDTFNRLVMTAGLVWREAALLRAYAAYMRQLGSAFGPRYIADTLARHPGVVRDLVALFRARFDPDQSASPEARERATQPVITGIEAALADVASLDEDRILRQILALVTATLRTNVYQRRDDGQPPQTIAFKFDGSRLAFAPAPRPYREIFVASPRVEGVHLRFAPIARGGIRWSDRAQDYRTEVLGLARAQQVKNAVIVPAGAKGGFYPKALPRAGGRDEIQQEGVAAYTIFVSAMLDLTDNIADGAIVPPERIVRHDGDDPYLVVAADKGTATFSDTANAISLERGFWLGDAFASGGSAGYDHKALGITARGAWECVKRHFREMDRDIQNQPFTVVGVGDMSGDVFGNGMLLSRHIRLIAAFDHRDIFLDPAPDAAVSFAERQRLFVTPRSSWAQYDRACLSPGGGVFSRQAKSIALSPEIRSALGIAAEALAPNDLLRAILKADVDLLWFGGIGTYVRASGETDAEAGDRTNDAIRIAATEVRAKVVGEGANLGITQRARVEAATRGVRLNTDFIDNSAGVNTSDQEVNIKIALGAAMLGGTLSIEERNRRLTAMTDDVAAGVLRNNYQQSLALSLAERRQATDLGAIGHLIRDLERRGLVERQLEALPSDHELERRGRQGVGLTRPELAVVMSYAKIAVLHDLLASKVPDDPYFADQLTGYFPEPLRQPFSGEIANHRLAREIVATTLTNGLVNRLGAAMPLALADAAGRPLVETAFAVMAARGTLDLAPLWQRIDDLDGRVQGTVQLQLYERVRRALVSMTSDFLRDNVASRPLSETVARYGAASRQIAASQATVVPPARAARLAAEIASVEALGVPGDLASSLVHLDILVAVPAIVATAARAQKDVVTAAGAYLALASGLRIDDIAARAQELTLSDDYDRLAIGGGLASLGEAHKRLVVSSLRRRPALNHADVRAWLAELGDVGARTESDLEAIAGAQDMSVARLAVASARLTGLADAAEALAT